MTPDALQTRSGWSRLFTEPRRPVWVRDHRRAHWFVVSSVCIGAFMGQLDASIVTLATPALQQHFEVSLGAASWVALSYLMVLVAAVVPIGRLADSVGRKMLYIYGFAVFTIASLGCALAPSIVALDGFRVVQAIGAAMLQANSVALIRLAMPPGMVGRGIGIQGVAQALGLALGPSIGGLLVHAGGWRLVFLVNLPARVVGIIAGLLLLPRSRELQRPRRVDYTGVLLLVPAVACVLLTLTNVQHAAIAAPAVVVPAIVAIGSIAGLASHTRRLLRRREEPLLPIDLFAIREFSSAIGAGLLSYLVLFGMLFITPFQLERALGWQPNTAGLLLTLLPASIAVSTPLAGRLADRKGARLPTTIGMVVATTGFAIAVVGSHSVAALCAALIIIGAGSGLFTPANNAAIMITSPPHRASIAGGVLNMTRALGTALGVAITSLVYEIAGSGVNGYRAAMLTLAVLAAFAATISRTVAVHPR
jgi:EmrB/QacA subfamily drug resistance transporter